MFRLSFEASRLQLLFILIFLSCKIRFFLSLSLCLSFLLQDTLWSRFLLHGNPERNCGKCPKGFYYAMSILGASFQFVSLFFSNNFFVQNVSKKIKSLKLFLFFGWFQCCPQRLFYKPHYFNCIFVGLIMKIFVDISTKKLFLLFKVERIL